MKRWRAPGPITDQGAEASAVAHTHAAFMRALERDVPAIWIKRPFRRHGRAMHRAIVKHNRRIRIQAGVLRFIRTIGEHQEALYERALLTGSLNLSYLYGAETILPERFPELYREYDAGPYRVITDWGLPIIMPPNYPYINPIID